MKTPAELSSDKIIGAVRSTIHDTGIIDKEINNFNNKLLGRKDITVDNKTYTANDIQYLKDHGYTEKDAIIYLSTTDKYKNPAGPNGKCYEENDIAYLMKNGYSRENAMEYLSNCIKYKKPTTADIQKEAEERVHKMAEGYVDGVLDNILSNEIKKINGATGSSLVWDEATKEQVRNAIRGHCNVVFTSDKIIQSAVTKTEITLKKIVDERVNSVLDTKSKSIINFFDSSSKKIIDFDDARKKMQLEDVMKRVTGQLEKGLNGIKALNSLDHTLGDIDNKLQSIGLDLGLQKELKGVMGTLTKNVANDISKQLLPKITQEIKAVQVVADQIKAAETFVKREQEIAKAMIKQWQDEATAAIKQEEERLIKNALGSIKIKW